MKNFLLFLLLHCQIISFAQFDTTFDGDGVVLPPYMLPMSTTYFVSSNRQIGQTPDGKILTFGNSTEVGGGPQVIRRYLPDGTIDNLFGSNGVCVVPYGPSQFATNWSKCSFLSNGKILLLNYSQMHNTGTAAIHFTQLNEDGSVDLSYGINGTKDIPNVYFFQWSVDELMFLPDGRIYIIGQNRFNVGNDYYFIPVVIGLNANHHIDQNFGVGGIFTPESLGISNFSTNPKVVCLSDDGSLLINTAGDTGKNPIRMTPTGQVDTSFGINGIMTTEKIIYGLIPVADNKFWGCGPLYLYGISTWSITRYNDDLSIDQSFGVDGSVEGSFGKRTVLQPDGKVIAMRNPGTSGFISSYTAFVKRLNSDGSLDADFQILFGENASKQIFDIALQPDGKILACGAYQYPESNLPTITAPWLARLMPELESPPLGLQHYSVQQASLYPNPFKDRFTVSYELDFAQKISVDLIDLQGRLIDRICDNEMQSGFVERDFVLAGLSAGTYILKIISGSGMQKSLKIVKN